MECSTLHGRGRKNQSSPFYQDIISQWDQEQSFKSNITPLIITFYLCFLKYNYNLFIKMFDSMNGLFLIMSEWSTKQIFVLSCCRAVHRFKSRTLFVYSKEVVWNFSQIKSPIVEKSVWGAFCNLTHFVLRGYYLNIQLGSVTSDYTGISSPRTRIRSALFPFKPDDTKLSNQRSQQTLETALHYRGHKVTAKDPFTMV